VSVRTTSSVGLTDLAVEEMPATRRAVGQAENDMNMEARFPVVPDGNVADRAQYLALLRDLDLLLRLPVDVEPTNGRPLEGSDCRQRCRRDAGVVREFREGRESLFSGVENDDAGLSPAIARYPGALHDNPAALRFV